MKILVIHKSAIEQIPPVLNVINILHQLKYNVVSINTGIYESTAKQLVEKGIDVNVINDYKGNNKFKKIISYQNYKKRVLNLIEEYASKDSVLLWIEGASTIFALGTSFKKYKYILQISELHEDYKYQLKAIGRVINEAELVFMPEYNRAAIYRVWFHLLKLPIILPNKPESVANEEDLKLIKEKHIEKIKEIERYKIIIYQGSIQKKRDISSIIKAVKELGGDYRVLVMGRHNKTLEEYKTLDNQLIHIDFTPAPEHLVYTSKAYIGVLSYDPYSLNNAFCAPNKTFEYSKFGIPLICNELPGLKSVIDTYKTGKAIDINNVESIKNAILEIDANYEFYSNNAKEYYKAVNCKEIIRNALKSIGL